MKYKMTYPQFLIFHEFIVDLNFFNFIIMPKSGVGVKSNTGRILLLFNETKYCKLKLNMLHCQQTKSLRNND